MKELIFFLHLFRPYQHWLIGGIILSILTALASISLLTLSGWFITASAIAGLLAPDGVAITFNFMQPAAEIRALAIIRTVGRYAERVVTHEATFRVLAEIRHWFFGKLIPLAPGQLAMQRSADLLSNITQDIDALDALYIRLASPLLVAFLGGGGVIVFISFYSMQIAYLSAAFLIISAILVPWLFMHLGRSSAKRLLEQNTNFKVKQVEILQGLAELVIFNAEKKLQKQSKIVSEQIIETQREVKHLSAISSTITALLSQLTLCLALVIGSILFQLGKISGAEFVMLCFAVFAVHELVAPLALSMQLFEKTLVAAKRILNITNLTPVISEPKHPITMPSSGDVLIRNLNFRYTETSDWVLKNINLDIPQGSKIAIVGPSGSGKTTLLQLIMRHYDPQQGSVKYDGIDYQQFNSDQLLSHLSVLSQHTQLFAATVKENLLIANPAATEQEIYLAIKMSGLTQFIKKLPKGLNSWVGENGAKVSGGEARRIALARVYLKNAPILLLDEPTEGLDDKTEYEVLNALQQIAKHKTLIMVTHRHAGLKLIDNVYQIKGGQLYQV